MRLVRIVAGEQLLHFPSLFAVNNEAVRGQTRWLECLIESPAVHQGADLCLILDKVEPHELKVPPRECFDVFGAWLADDGEVDPNLYDRKSVEGRREQAVINGRLQESESSSRNYMEEGVTLLELAQEAEPLYVKQEMAQKAATRTACVLELDLAGGRTSRRIPPTA